MIGIPVGEEFRVNATTMDRQDDPNVAVDAQGNYVVVWESIDPDKPESGDVGIFAQRYDRFGNALGSEIEVANEAAPNNGANPVVGKDADGNFVVSWTGNAGNRSRDTVNARRFDSNGNTLGDSFRVNTATIDNKNSPDIAMNANGQFVITWESRNQDGDRNGIFAQVYDPTGNPVGGEIAVNNITTGDQRTPAVGIDGSGNFVIAWTDNVGDRDSDDTVNARRFDSAGTPLGESFLVSTIPDIDHDTPDIAMNASGEFVIAWESFGQDGDGSGVFAQKYNNAGEKSGDEIAVNTITIGNQDDPSVAIDANGNFFISWEGVGQDGGGDLAGIFDLDGIFGQYF
ncbi:MAG: hypothetical protein AAFU78_06060, partial [Cyanobacteria bacterium J06633_2]